VRHTSRSALVDRRATGKPEHPRAVVLCYKPRFVPRRRPEPALLALALLALLTAACTGQEQPGGVAAETTSSAPFDLRGPDVVAVEGAAFVPDGPPSAGPAAELLAAVDLSGVPGEDVYAVAATPHDGGAYVVVTDQAGEGKRWVVTVGGDGESLAVTDVDEIPPLDTLDGHDVLHALDDGTVLVAGRLPPPPAVTEGADYGFVVLDPATGASRQTVVFPAGGPSSAAGRTVLSADGRTLFALADDPDLGPDWQLVAVDVATGAVVAEHDLRTDPWAAGYARLDSWGIAARSDGGARVLVRGESEDGSGLAVPLLADYAPDLRPLGQPVRLLDEPADALSSLVRTGTDGTAFAVVETDEDVWLVAVPEGADAGIRLIRGELDWLARQAVDPGQTWLTVPVQWGAVSVDLTTGESAAPVAVECRGGEGVRWTVPGADGTTLLLGECDGAETLWIAGP
jgi:hypothetical protein